MKKILLLFLFGLIMTTSAFSERQPLPIEIHQTGASDINTEPERTPINLPIAVYYDTETNVLEVWCDNDNIQAEVFVYDESGAVEAYSPYMNVAFYIEINASEGQEILG